MRQGHTPFGYRIKDGKAVICHEEAEQVRQIYTGYISGLSLKKAAEAAELKMQHAQLKRMLQNKHYLGDAFYPAIIDRKTFDAAELEYKSRRGVLGRDHFHKKEACSRVPITKFRMTKTDQVFNDPYEQAQYIYSLIESEV